MDDGRVLSEVAADSVSGDTRQAAASYEFKLKRAGSGTASVTTSLTLASGKPYTLVAYASADALKTRLLQEDEDAPSSGTAKLRVVNLATSAGSVDVYVTDTDAALAPNFSGVAGDGASAYNEISTGNYRVRVTGTGDPADLRLDIPTLALPDGADVTLAVLGDAAAAQCHAIADDNRPSGVSGNARLRLLHGVYDLGANLSLSADYGAVASEVAFGTASTLVGIAAGDDYRLEASSSASAGALYLASDVSLQAGHVYTVFLLGVAASPTAVLRRDR